MGQVSSTRPQASNQDQRTSHSHAPNVESQSTNTSHGGRRQSMSSSLATLSQYHPLNADQEHTRLRTISAETQRRTNYQRERRQALSSSQRAERLAQRRANYHSRRRSRVMPDLSQQLIHGKPLGEDNLRVSIIRAVVDDAKLLFPITGDDIVTVVDALGSIVAWPKNMVVTPAPQVPPKIVVEEVALAPQASTKAIAKKATTSAQATRKVTNPKQTIKTVVTRRSRIVDDDDKVDLKNLPRDIPLSLRHLCAYAHDFMVDGRTIYTEFHQSLFGQPRKACFYRKDLHSMANMGEVSIGVLVFYMNFLHKGLVKSKGQKVFGFIDPAHTGISNCGIAKERAKHMADRYKQEKSVQLWLVPYNPGGHWVLTVVKPTEGLVYYLDPIKRKITCDAEWKSVVENSINWSRAAAEEKDEDKDFEITWPALKGVPEQKGDSTCGYFVMRYMREIVKSTDIMEFATKWADKRLGRAGLFTFTKAEIDEVRNEWAQHVDTFPETIERRT